jgi:hypothetical protein
MNILISTKKFQKDKDLRVRDCQEQLYQKLSQRPISLEAETLTKYFPLLEQEVLYPAVELKEAISCSLAVYDFIEPEDSSWHVISQGSQTQDYILKDVTTWRTKNNPEEISGIFCCLFPGVYQKEVQQSKNLSLIKPVVIVYDREADRQLQELGQTRSPEHPKSKTSSPKTNKVPSQSRSPISRPLTKKNTVETQPTPPARERETFCMPCAALIQSKGNDFSATSEQQSTERPKKIKYTQTKSINSSLPPDIVSNSRDTTTTMTRVPPAQHRRLQSIRDDGEQLHSKKRLETYPRERHARDNSDIEVEEIRTAKPSRPHDRQVRMSPVYRTEGMDPNSEEFMRKFASTHHGTWS